MHTIVRRPSSGPLSVFRGTAAASILPGALGAFTATLVPVSIWNLLTAPEFMPSWGQFAAEGAMLLLPAAIGCWVATRVMRPHLRAEAEVAGRRGVIAGAASVFAQLTSVAVLAGVFRHPSLGAMSATGLAVGAAVAATMFFPWLMNRDERSAMRELEG